MEERIKPYLNCIHAHREFENKTCPGKKFDLGVLKLKVHDIFMRKGFGAPMGSALIPLVQPVNCIWSEIIEHHSAVPDGSITSDWEGTWKYHVTDPQHLWRAIGYNYGLEQDNGVWVYRVGRSLSMDGGHTVGHNKKAVGICVIGNYDLLAPPEIALDMNAELLWELFVLKIVVPE